MSIGYQKILNLPDGYMVQQPLSPRLQTFNANNEILGILGELTLFAAPDNTVRTFRLPVATKPGQQCALKSIAETATGAVNVIASFDYDNGYQQILYAGQAGSTLHEFHLHTFPGENAVFVSGTDVNNPLRLNWFLANYHQGAAPGGGIYKWIWPDATARINTLASSSDIGEIGLQLDIEREFKLLSLSGGAPYRWGKVPASDIECWRHMVSRSGEAFLDSQGIRHAQFGNTFGYVPIPERPLIVAGRFTGNAAPGLVNTGFIEDGAGCPLASGCRYISEFIFIEQFSPSVRWFVGVTSPRIPSANTDYGILPNIFGVGRNNNQANIQLFRNDGSGNAVLTDLGASFPATSLPATFQLELYFPPDNAKAAFNLNNRINKVEISGSFTTDIPNPTVAMNWSYHMCNNAHDAQVSFGFGYMKTGQIAF